MTTISAASKHTHSFSCKRVLEVRRLTAAFVSRGSRGESISLPFPSSGSHLGFLGTWPLLHLESHEHSTISPLTPSYSSYKDPRDDSGATGITSLNQEPELNRFSKVPSAIEGDVTQVSGVWMRASVRNWGRALFSLPNE